VCGKRLCWRSTTAGFRYRDPARRSAGIRQLTLLADAGGETRIALAAGGPSLPALGLPYDPPVTTQLVRTDAAGCWTARMTLPRKSGPTRFVGRSD
jgi:hypothetical protein